MISYDFMVFSKLQDLPQEGKTRLYLSPDSQLDHRGAASGGQPHRMELHRRIRPASHKRARKNGIAAFHDYAEFSRDHKSLSCTAFRRIFPVKAKASSISIHTTAVPANRIHSGSESCAAISICLSFRRSRLPAVHRTLPRRYAPSRRSPHCRQRSFRRRCARCTAPSSQPRSQPPGKPC